MTHSSSAWMTAPVAAAVITGLVAILALAVNQYQDGVGTLRDISVERGLDPREFALLAFGGIGGIGGIGGSGRCWLSGEIERYLRKEKVAR